MESVIDDFMSHVPKLISRYWKSALTIPMCQRGTHLEGYTFLYFQKRIYVRRGLIQEHCFHQTTS